VGDGELLPYRYGIEFTDIEANKKEKIVAYIFEVQRMRIKLAKSMALS
jgi:c-di-GMP-binding flagellar brake protein YcgR